MATRLPAATYAMPAVTTPTATPSATRNCRVARIGRAENRRGRRRSTSTNITIVTVSTRNWVSARSGAPCRMNSSAVP